MSRYDFPLLLNRFCELPHAGTLCTFAISEEILSHKVNAKIRSRVNSFLVVTLTKQCCSVCGVVSVWKLCII